MTFSRFSFFLVVLLCLGGALGLSARALQAAPADAGTAAKTRSQPPADTEQETGDDVYRHSASVKLLARWLHLDKESAARLFEYLNFAILAGAILFALLEVPAQDLPGKPGRHPASAGGCADGHRAGQ